MVAVRGFCSGVVFGTIPHCAYSLRESLFLISHPRWGLSVTASVQINLVTFAWDSAQTLRLVAKEDVVVTDDEGNESTSRIYEIEGPLCFASARKFKVSWFAQATAVQPFSTCGRGQSAGFVFAVVKRGFGVGDPCEAG